MPGELPTLGDCSRGQKGHHALVGYGYHHIHACLHVTPIADSCFLFSISCYMSSCRQGPPILCKTREQLRAIFQAASLHTPPSFPTHWHITHQGLYHPVQGEDTLLPGWLGVRLIRDTVG